MKKSGTSPLMIVVLIALGLAGWFLLPGWPIGALLVGGAVGLVAAKAMLPVLSDLPPKIAIGMAIGVVLFALLLLHMTRSELAFLNLGETAANVQGVAHALAGMFGGIALRCLVQAATATKQG